MNEYKKRGLLTAYALLNTQNVNGLRPECIREQELVDNGKAHFKNSTGSQHESSF